MPAHCQTGVGLRLRCSEILTALPKAAGRVSTVHRDISSYRRGCRDEAPIEITAVRRKLEQLEYFVEFYLHLAIFIEFLWVFAVCGTMPRFLRSLRRG